jgi:hypothetical protein
MTLDRAGILRIPPSERGSNDVETGRRTPEQRNGNSPAGRDGPWSTLTTGLTQASRQQCRQEKLASATQDFAVLPHSCPSLPLALTIGRV